MPSPNPDGVVNLQDLGQAVALLRSAGDSGLRRRDLEKALNLSPRQVNRLLARLREDGAEIESAPRGQDKHHWFVLKKPPTWDERVTPEARMALSLALEALGRMSPSVWGDHLDRLMALADERMTKADRDLFSVLRSRVFVTGGVDDPPPFDWKVIEPLLKALGASPRTRIVEVTYQAPARKPFAHPMVPHALIQDVQSGGSYLLAWNLKYNAPNLLRLTRILQVKLQPRHSLLTPGEVAKLDRVREFQIGGWYEDREPSRIEATIEGVNLVDALMEAPPHLPRFEMHPAKDRKTARIVFWATDLGAAKRWLATMPVTGIEIG